MSLLAHEENGLFIKTSTVLSGVRHGFSSRIGGAIVLLIASILFAFL